MDRFEDARHCFYFIKLPLSVRKNIYRILFKSRKPRRPLQRIYVNGIFKAKDNDEQTRRRCISRGLGLLETCHQVSEEATDVLYGENAFLLVSSQIHVFEQFFAQGIQNLAKITSLQIDFRHLYEGEEFFHETCISYLDSGWVEEHCCFVPTTYHRPISMGHFWWDDHQLIFDFEHEADQICWDCFHWPKMLDAMADHVQYWDLNMDDDDDADRWRELGKQYVLQPTNEQRQQREPRVAPQVMDFLLKFPTFVFLLQSCSKLEHLEIHFPGVLRLLESRSIRFDENRWTDIRGRMGDQMVDLLQHCGDLQSLALHGLADLDWIESIVSCRRPDNVSVVLSRSKSHPWQLIEVNLPLKVPSSCHWSFSSLKEDEIHQWILKKPGQGSVDHFSALPPEIRGLIYSYLLPHNSWPRHWRFPHECYIFPPGWTYRTLTTRIHCHRKCCVPGWIDDAEQDQMLDFNICRVSRLIHNETRTLLHNSALTIIISSLPWLMHGPCALRAGEVEYDPIPSAFVSIPSVAINLCFPTNEHLSSLITRYTNRTIKYEEWWYDEGTCTYAPQCTELSENRRGEILDKLREVFELSPRKRARYFLYEARQMLFDDTNIFRRPHWDMGYAQVDNVWYSNKTLHLYFPEGMRVFRGDSNGSRQFSNVIVDKKVGLARLVEQLGIQRLQLGYSVDLKTAELLGQMACLQRLSIVPPRNHQWTASDVAWMEQNDWHVERLGAVPGQRSAEVCWKAFRGPGSRFEKSKRTSLTIRDGLEPQTSTFR